MSQAGPSMSRYSLRDNPARRRKRSDDTLEGESDVCQAWREGKCTKGRKCRLRHGKYRRTDNHRPTRDEEEVLDQVIEEAEAVEQFIVLDYNLVTYGPGLEIRNIVAGYDLSQIILQLPIDRTKEDIEQLFLQQGLAMFDFHVLKIDFSENSVLRATVVTKTQHGRKKVIEGLRKKGVDFVEVRNGAIWTDKPTLIVTWASNNTNTNRAERRVTRSSSNPSLTFETVYQTLCESQGAQMKTCYLFNMGPTFEEALAVEFDTWENAEATANAIEEMDIPSLECNIHIPHQYSIRIPVAQYKAQKKQWLAFIKKKKKQEACVKIKIGENSAAIQVEGKDKMTIGALKTRVDTLSRGEVLDGTYWHPSFASSGGTFFQRLTDTTAVHIRCDPDIQALRLFGETKRINQARTMIQEEVQEREQLVTKTRLTGASVSFFQGEGVGKLQELVGEDKVDLKVTPKTTTIMVRGGEEVTHHFQRLLGESSVGTSGGRHGSNRPTCPVCLNEASHPERLACGHAYCPGCLNNLLSAVVDSKNFPIICIGDEATCGVPISLQFIHRFLPQYTFKRLLEAAFVTHFEQNPMQFQYCVTSGCGQTFRRKTSDSKAAVLNCPSCFGRICASCAVLAHDNVSCKEYQRQKELQLQETLFVGLARAKDFRRCPRCKILVEKDGGCDSMYCRCNRSLNWKDFTLL